jgi:D-inositol-3-phosphate glycosyltransferase
MGAAKKNDWIHRLMYRKISAFITSSKGTNDFVKENYAVQPEQVFWIPYGRQIEQYKPYLQERQALRAENKVNENQIVLMSMSRIDPQKGIQEFAEAIMLLTEEEKKKIQVWIVGEPSIVKTLPDGTKIYESFCENLDNWLNNYITDHHLEQTVKRFPFQKDYIQWLAAADVVVLPSYEEMYALTVIDAMLMHKPVIGTNTGGTPEQITDHENGLLIAPKNAEAIANAIRFYLQEPSKIQEHGQNAFQWATKTHAMAESMKKLEDIYKKTISHS